MITDRATDREQAAAWRMLMRSSKNTDEALMDAHDWLEATVRTREARKTPKRRPQESDELKRFLAIKFPSTVNELSAYHAVMGFDHQPQSVDVTLRHGSTVIHCNNPNGLKAARQYLKEVSK